MVKFLIEFILKIFGNNQPSGGSNQQPFGGGQPSGNQPSGGGGGPSGGPSWPQTPQDRPRRPKSTCGQDSCGLQENGQWNCLNSFYEKAALRYKALKSENPGDRSFNQGRLTNISHIRNKVGDKNFDFTNHEIESFIKVINNTNKMEVNTVIMKKFGLNQFNEYPEEFLAKLAYRARNVGGDTVLFQKNKNKYNVLTNVDLYNIIMKKLNIW